GKFEKAEDVPNSEGPMSRLESPGTAAARGFLRISVSDTGIGIKPTDQQRVFLEFEQADSSYARQQQGTGLGLSLTRKLVEMHGGCIWVESEGVEGRGSTFSFLIPFSEPPEPEAEDQAQESRREAPTPKSLPPAEKGQRLVLVVEDERAAGELI